jgi:serine/threonine protein kinase
VVPNEERLKKGIPFMVNGNSYIMLSVIGKGGSSQVFKVLSREKKLYALKQIVLGGAEQGGGNSHQAAYRNEIALLLKLRGRAHVIQLVDTEEVTEVAADGSETGVTVIYMLFENGHIDLGTYLKRRWRLRQRGGADDGASGLDEVTVRYIWREMLLCVNVCHEHHVIHLDIKPPNFVFVDGSLKVIDFGIAKAPVNSDETSVIRESQVGTVNYMSPESLRQSRKQAQGQFQLNRSSDVWSLGCILYQLVYGRTPFSSLSLVPKLLAITDENHESKCLSRASVLCCSSVLSTFAPPRGHLCVSLLDHVRSRKPSCLFHLLAI